MNVFMDVYSLAFLTGSRKLKQTDRSRWLQRQFIKGSYIVGWAFPGTQLFYRQLDVTLKCRSLFLQR